jgi:hypothetical protein
MAKGRFLQLTSVLHFNDNLDVDGKNRDSLHKVWPLLNIVKIRLGKYAILGRIVAQ